MEDSTKTERNKVILIGKFQGRINDDSFKLYVEPENNANDSFIIHTTKGVLDRISVDLEENSMVAVKGILKNHNEEMMVFATKMTYIDMIDDPDQGNNIKTIV